MHPVIAKTFGGLSASYYFRHLIFGMAFPVFIYFMLGQGNRPVQMSTVVLLLVNTLLYPYSRFVYESVMDFFLGNNVFLVNAVLMLAMKLMTMLFCWAFAIFVAPIGLAYLYLYHSRASK